MPGRPGGDIGTVRKRTSLAQRGRQHAPSFAAFWVLSMVLWLLFTSTVAPSEAGVGMCASLACVVHCAVFPVVLAALPALGLAWLDAEWVDWTMVLLAAGIALRAHRGGFTVHRRCLPTGVAVVGLLTILLMVLWKPSVPKKLKVIPAPLVAVTVATGVPVIGRA